MWTSAKSLWEASRPETYPAATLGSSKFADGQMSLGGPSMFFKGLDDFIGPPNPNVREAMTHEHTTHKDSTDEFVAQNYQTKTTSRREWYFVVEPKDGLKKIVIREENGVKEYLSEWPKEGCPPSAGVSKVGVSKPGVSKTDGATVRPQTGKTRSLRPGPRTQRELTDFEAELNIRNGFLRDLGEAPITWDEFIGARLYTGPMCA
jgi:hypothetical protein